MKNFVKATYLFLALFLTYQSVKAQDNVSTEAGKQVILGNLLINSSNNNLYLKTEGCEDSILYYLNFDIDNWKFDYNNSNKYGNKLAFKMYGKKKIEEINQEAKLEISKTKVMSKFLVKDFKRGSNSIVDYYEEYLKSPQYSYINSIGIPEKLELGVFFETYDGFYKLDFTDKCSISYKKHFNAAEENLLAVSLDTLNKDNFISFHNGLIGLNEMSISTKSNNGFNVQLYNTKLKQFHPEIIPSTNSYSSVSVSSRGLQALKIIPTVQVVSEVNKDLNLIIFSSTEVSFFNKKDGLEKLKSPITTTDTLKQPKDLYAFAKSGGLAKYNDTLLEVLNFSKNNFTGSFDETGKSFNLTSFPNEPLGRLSSFTTEKFNYNELLEMCPNKPDVIKELAQLNQEFNQIEIKSRQEQSELKHFQFISEETKDASGLTITSVKVLKDCKNFDLENTTEKQVLKDLLKKKNGELGKAIVNLISVSSKFIVLNSKINGCDASGGDGSSTGVLASIEKIANKVTQGGLKLILVSTGTRVTNILNSTKNAQSEVENAEKVIESYKKTN
jgi:hypothetical protein